MTDTEPGAAVPPGVAMMTLLDGFQISQAVYVVAEAGVATILEQEGPATVAELAERTGLRADALRRLVRTLAAYGVFSTDGDRVAVTAVGATLSEAHPETLYNLALMRMETHYLPFSELSTSARTGEPAADRWLGEPFFDWVAREPQREQLFSKAMADVTGGLRTGMFDDYRLPPGDLVADIGGSDGSVLIELLSRDPDPRRRGLVFDRPTTVGQAEISIKAAGLQDRVGVVGGDFFVEVPAADVYVLGMILHDWDDAACRHILASIRAAAAPGARLLVLEGVVPPGDAPHWIKNLDLTMLGMLTGKERSEHEYRELLEAAGFALDRVLATPCPYSIIEATLR